MASTGLPVGDVKHQNTRKNQNPYINDFVRERPFIKKDFNQWNRIGLASTIINITPKFGFLADVTFNSWGEQYWDYKNKDENGNPKPDDPNDPNSKPTVSIPNT